MSIGQNSKALCYTLVRVEIYALEVHQRMFTGNRVMGRLRRQMLILQRRGLIEEIRSLQPNHYAYKITPKGLATLDLWRLDYYYHPSTNGC